VGLAREPFSLDPTIYTTITKTTWTRVIIHGLSKHILGSKRIRILKNLAQVFRDPKKCCSLLEKLAILPK
jgi:hypothetical protein